MSFTATAKAANDLDAMAPQRQTVVPRTMVELTKLALPSTTLR